MNNKQKQRLERNLSKSASGAKPYWPRALIGPGVESQGYINPKLLPLGDTSLGELLESHIELSEELNNFKTQIEKTLDIMSRENKVLTRENELLRQRLSDLEAMSLD